MHLLSFSRELYLKKLIFVECEYQKKSHKSLIHWTENAYVKLYSILYHLHNLKDVKNTHGGVRF